MFLGKLKIRFWENFRFLGNIFGEVVFLGWYENCNKIQEVRLCEKRVTKGDVKRYR